MNYDCHSLDSHQNSFSVINLVYFKHQDEESKENDPSQMNGEKEVLSHSICLCMHF